MWWTSLHRTADFDDQDSSSDALQTHTHVYVIGHNFTYACVYLKIRVYLLSSNIV